VTTRTRPYVIPSSGQRIRVDAALDPRVLDRLNALAPPLEITGTCAGHPRFAFILLGADDAHAMLLAHLRVAVRDDLIATAWVDDPVNEPRWGLFLRPHPHLDPTRGRFRHAVSRLEEAYRAVNP
jgi:hypothetical protein